MSGSGWAGQGEYRCGQQQPTADKQERSVCQSVKSADTNLVPALTKMPKVFIKRMKNCQSVL